MQRAPEPSQIDQFSACLIDGDPGPVNGLFQRLGLTPPTILWNPAPGETGVASFDFLLEHWNCRRGERGWPDEGDIDPVALRPTLGSLMLCEPVDDGRDFRIRLYGSRLAQYMERDLTGLRISEVRPGNMVSDFYCASYRAVSDRRVPLFTRHQPSEDSFASEINRLLLPFGPGEGITRILTSVDAVARRPLARPSWTTRN